MGNSRGTPHTPTGIKPGLAITDSNEYQRQYRLKNKDRINKNRKEWLDNCSEETKEKIKEGAKRWRQSPAGKANLKAARDRHKQERVDFIRAAKDAPCVDCGVEYPHYVMDLHHRDPSDKLYTVSQMSGQNKSWVLIKAEIDKCDVICANCHRERHHGPTL